MKKESLSIIFVKTLLAVLLFAGVGTIIVGGGYIIGEYSKNKVSNEILKPANQEAENYYDVLEKKCDGNTCCLSSLKIMKENNYKEASKDYKCPDRFKLGGLRCINSLKWCELIKECVDDQNNRREIGEIWLESPTMFMKCNKFGSVASNYVLSCGNEKLIISNSLSFDENSIYRDISSSPFSIGTDGSLRYTWIIDGNKYTSSSGGPTGVFASCEDEKATIFHFGGMGESYYSKTFFDDNYKIRIKCLDSYEEGGIYGEGIYDKDDPENFTISKVKDGEKIVEPKLLENGKEICQEIKEKYQELKKMAIDNSNWQTYRNEEFGFEVKYPSEFSPQKVSQFELDKMIFSVGNTIYKFSVSRYSEEYISEKKALYTEEYCSKNGGYNDCMFWTTHLNEWNGDSKIFISKSNGDNCKEECDNYKSHCLDCEVVSSGNEKAIEKIIFPLPNEDYFHWRLTVEKGGNHFYLDLATNFHELAKEEGVVSQDFSLQQLISNQKDKESKKTFNQILSSFKFIEK